LKRELGLLSERLTRAQVESQQLRAERDEMLSQIKEIDSALRIKGGCVLNAISRACCRQIWVWDCRCSVPTDINPAEVQHIMTA
jgi:hypothetical protein